MKFLQDRLNRKWTEFVKWVASIAPNAKIAEVSSRAYELTESLRNEQILGDALLVLAMELGEMDDHGSISSNMISKIKENKRLHWALTVACHIHAGYACSPFGGGIGLFKKGIDEWANEEERNRKLMQWSGM